MVAAIHATTAAIHSLIKPSSIVGHAATAATAAMATAAVLRCNYFEGKTTQE